MYVAPKIAVVTTYIIPKFENLCVGYVLTLTCLRGSITWTQHFIPLTFLCPLFLPLPKYQLCNFWWKKSKLAFLGTINVWRLFLTKYFWRFCSSRTALIRLEFDFKGGYAHSNMHIFHFWLIDLGLWNAFCEVSPWGSFLFTHQRQNKVCTPGDEAIMKIHKKLFSGIRFNFTLFVISPKLVQSIWSWNFGFTIRKIWAFIWYQKYTTSGWAMGDENVISIRAFNLKCVCRHLPCVCRYLPCKLTLASSAGVARNNLMLEYMFLACIFSILLNDLSILFHRMISAMKLISN